MKRYEFEKKYLSVNPEEAKGLWEAEYNLNKIRLRTERVCSLPPSLPPSWMALTVSRSSQGPCSTI
jgi:hypothetical protein